MMYQWNVHYDSPDSVPYIGCSDIHPLLTFIFGDGPWCPDKSREICQEEAQREGISHVVLRGGEGRRIDIFLKHRDWKLGE
jgi:hypothetical protein